MKRLFFLFLLFPTVGFAHYKNPTTFIPVGPEIKNNGIAYQMFINPKTQIIYPRLTRLPNQNLLQRTNTLLKKQQVEDIELYKSCQIANNNGIKNNWGESTEILMFSPQILSFKIHYSYYCGGPYPDEHDEYFNYDLTKGTVFDFKKFFIPKVDEASPYNPIKKIATALYSDKIASKEGDAQCMELYSSEQPNEYQLAFSPHGLLFLLKLPHSVQLCATELIIPYKKIEPYLQKGANKYLNGINIQSTNEN